MRKWLQEKGIITEGMEIKDEVIFDHLKKIPAFLAAVNRGRKEKSPEQAVTALTESKADIIKHCKDML